MSWSVTRANRCDCGRRRRPYFDTCYRCWLGRLPADVREQHLIERHRKDSERHNASPDHIEAMARLAELPPLPTVLPGHGACVDCNQPIDQGVTRCPACRQNRLDGLAPATAPEPVVGVAEAKRVFQPQSERVNGPRPLRNPPKVCVDCGAVLDGRYARCHPCHLSSTVSKFV